MLHWIISVYEIIISLLLGRQYSWDFWLNLFKLLLYYIVY